jgi:hypothetical protein
LWVLITTGRPFLYTATTLYGSFRPDLFVFSRQRGTPNKSNSHNLPGLAKYAFTFLPPRSQIMVKRFGLERKTAFSVFLNNRKG